MSADVRERAKVRTFLQWRNSNTNVVSFVRFGKRRESGLATRVPPYTVPPPLLTPVFLWAFLQLLSAAVFLRASDLISTTHRNRLLAATMIGQV